MWLHRDGLQYFVLCVWFMKIPGSHLSSERKTVKPWRDDGRCGESHPLPNGEPGQCDPTADANEKGPCCSDLGWCGNSDAHCKCSSCVNYADLHEWTVYANAIKSRLDNIPPRRDTTSETSKILQKLDDAIRESGAGLIKVPQYNVIEDLFLKIVENHSLDDHFPDFASSFQYSVLPTAIQSENLESPLLKSKLETPFPKAIDDSAQLHEVEVTFNGNYESPCTAGIARVPICHFRKWISTGLYAKQGQLVKVTVPSNVVGKFRISIGSHTDKTYEDNLERWLNFQNPFRPCCITQFYDRELIKSETRLLSAYGGLIYVDITAPSHLGTFTLKFDNVITSPTFTEGKTTNEQWSDMLASTKSPMVELEVPGVIVTIPKYFFDEAPLNMERCANRYTKLMEAFYDMAGFAIPAPQRYVYDYEGTIGGAHSGYPIMDGDFPYSRELLQLANGTHDHHIWNIWAIPHELGHNIQSRMWTPNGLGETTNNIFAQYVNEEVFNENPNNLPDLNYVADFKENNKKFDSLGPWGFLNIFIMVQQECSWQTFKKFFKYYNEEIPEVLIPNTKEERYSLITRVLSEKCDKNLIPFFKWWNWPVLDDAEEATKDLPKWKGIIEILEEARKLCKGKDSDCCTSSNPCGVDDGDCDFDSDCETGLVCGDNNCSQKSGANWDATDDCCTPPKGPECLTESDTLFYGFDIDRKETSGEDDCAAWCAATDSCTGWSFRKSDNMCWIKNGNIYAIHRTNFISGQKCAIEEV